jgi:hypothetical protein
MASGLEAMCLEVEGCRRRRAESDWKRAVKQAAKEQGAQGT